MNETVLVIATIVAGSIGSPLVQYIKEFAQSAGKPIEGSAALNLTIGVSVALSILTLAMSNAFSPPYPVDVMGWITLIGGVAGSVFTIATVIFKRLVQPPK
jgi:uncharacterized membrane protein YdcZ (DUF606 family)